MSWSGRAAGGGAGCCAVFQGRRAGRAGGYLLPVWIRAAAWSAVLWIRQAGGVIRCSLCSRSATSAADRCGHWCPMCCGSGRAAGVDHEKKKKQAGRAGCGVVLPAVLCAAVIFCPGPAPRNAAGGTVSRFFRAVLCAAPEESDFTPNGISPYR